jgi:gluconolactonase
MWLVGCAGPGTGQPGDGQDAATPPPDGGAGDGGTGSDATAMGTDAPGGPGSDASNDSGTTGTPDAGPGGADASRDGANGGDGGPGAEGGTTGWSCANAGPIANPVPAWDAGAASKVAGVPPSDGFNNTLNNFTTVEGPVWVGDALYVSEFPGNPNPPPSRILKVAASGAVTVAMSDSSDGGPPPGVGSNGLAVDRNGNLFGAIHHDGSISRFDLSAGMRILPPIASSYMGNRFNSPNDLAIRSDGTIYFSDPTYQAPSPNPQMITRVYRFSPATGAVSVVDAMLTQPNGVTLSPDESALYVSSNNGIHKYAVASDGSTGAGSVFPQSPNAMLNVDGMAVDCAGNLYGAIINSGTVVVLDPTGKQIGSPIHVATAGNVTNVAFGGADHKTLYVTTQGSSGNQGLYQVPLSIPGMPY